MSAVGLLGRGVVGNVLVTCGLLGRGVSIEWRLRPVGKHEK